MGDTVFPHLTFFPTHSGGIQNVKTTYFQQVFKIEAWVHHSQFQPVEGTPLIFFCVHLDSAGENLSRLTTGMYDIE